MNKVLIFIAFWSALESASHSGATGAQAVNKQESRRDFSLRKHKMWRGKNVLGVQVLTNGSGKDEYSGSVLIVKFGFVLKGTLLDIIKNKIETSPM